MGLFIVDAELGKKVENHVRFDLQFPSQLVDANFAHIVRFSRPGILPAVYRAGPRQKNGRLDLPFISAA